VCSSDLDGMLHVAGARRGFVGIGDATGWRFLVSRNLEQADIDDPAACVSTTLITRALATLDGLVTEDALTELDVGSVHRLELRSVACFPLVHEGVVIGFVYFDDARTRGRFDAAAVQAIREWLPLAAGVVARTLERGPEPGLPGVVTRNPAMLDLLAELARVARFDASILLTGETGTGKSLIARQIHAASPRSGGPFVHLNCGALPEALLEAELFGAEAGAFTGATRRRIGSFQAASGGTIFLDELDAMPLGCQVRLLVALQERQITPLGSTTPIPIDVRVVAAMGRSADRALAEGKLREDLYFRLAVFVAELPPLRARPEDVLVLARSVLVRTAERFDLPPLRLSAHAQAELEAHPWPGNVRELENALDRAALLSRDGVIERLALRPATRAADVGPPAGGVTAALTKAAAALTDAMIADPSLRDTQFTRALDGALLVTLRARLGSIEQAFVFLGRGRAVEGRNHLKMWHRDVGRLGDLARRLGEPVPRGVDGSSGD
jgi:two-component system response regulator FlrC